MIQDDQRNKQMTRSLMVNGALVAVLGAASMFAQADQAGGNGCGWGNMVFEGHNGLAPHLLATTTNGTSGNATFGLTSGTNGCNKDAKLGYGGKSMFAMNGMLDNIAEDMASGKGEALDAYAVLLGIEAQDREHFANVTHQHFAEIFTQGKESGEQVYQNTLAVMERDAVLARYARQPV
jgi:hypothetical protein